MNNFFQENRRAALLLLCLVFLLLIAVYFLFYLPLAKDLKSTENQITTTKNDIEVLKVNIENASGETNQEDNIDRLRYADQLPMNPETEEIILTLEEIEYVSDSRIDSISFSYDGSIPNLVEEENEPTEPEENTEDTSIEDQGEDEIESVIDMEAKPENLHVITINLDVASPNYEQFQTFIKEIEKQERMMMVSSMDFQKPGEELELVENPDESITSNINVTTFYYGTE